MLLCTVRLITTLRRVFIYSRMPIYLRECIAFNFCQYSVYSALREQTCISEKYVVFATNLYLFTCKNPQMHSYTHINTHIVLITSTTRKFFRQYSTVDDLILGKLQSLIGSDSFNKWKYNAQMLCVKNKTMSCI